MTANVGERVAIAISICGDLISYIETVPASNPGLVKFMVAFTDGSHLHISEDWHAENLSKYSYYWLKSDNQLIIGWDNAPHHLRLSHFPHHKHTGQQSSLEPSEETNLEQVLTVIRDRLTTAN